MTSNKDLIWYVAYGSNLLRDRFLCYIKGGKTPTCNRMSKGCKDKSLPIKIRPTRIPHRLYFAKEATVWGEGAASFIEANASDQRTYARQYLIRFDQFIDIVLQENNESIENIVIDLKQVINQGQIFIGEGDDFDWYGRILYLGEDEGIPKLTFTAKWDDERMDYNKPSERYIKTIIKGLIETHELSQSEIIDYIKNLPGIKDHMTEDELGDLFS